MRRMQFHFRQAFRSLRRAPAYTAAFVVTLGLAIGVNSAVFSMVSGVILKPLPFQDAERLIYLKQPARTPGVENVSFSFMEVDDLRAGSTMFDEFVEFGDWDFTVSGEGDPHRAVGGLVTSNYFGVLAMRPALGRLLNADDDRPGAEPVVVLTDGYWDRVFGRDPAIVGRIVRLMNGVPAEMGGEPAPVPTRVVGVLEPGLHYTGSRQPDFYVNYATNSHYQSAAMRDARTHRMTDVFARLAPGATLEAARTELSLVNERVHAEYPETYRPEMRYGIEAIPWHEELTRNARGTFLFLMGAVGVILLLAAANVANLTLTRLIRKQGELSTRGALGASATDLRLHLTAEHILLGLGGGALGIMLAYVSRTSLVAYASRFTVRAQEVGVDWTVLGVTLGGGVLLAALLAWLPGLPVAPGVERVASAQSKATDSRRRKMMQRGLVVSQLALAFTLLVGAGLLVRSLLELSSVDPGFRTEQVVTLQSASAPGGFATPADAPVFQRALEEIRAYPGVRSAAAASWTPLSGDVTPTVRSVRIDGGMESEVAPQEVGINSVSPGYFETLGIPLVSGRYIDASDRRETRATIVINQSMARTYFGDVDPVGRIISSSQDGRNWGEPLEIVGVVADSREYGMEQEGVHTIYRSAEQASYGPAILVASSGDAGALAQHIRDVIHGLQPERAVDRFETMAALRDRSVAPSRLNAVLFGSFSVLALLIAAVGVLGALGFSVSQRVREFGIRMALGADRGAVLRDVLGEGVLLVTVALGIGVGAALFLGRFLAGLLFGVSPIDPLSMALAATALGSVALLAALLPAIRATRIQPSEALRAE
ncbi:MAG: ABC transporter permease [Gemmatimonadota bacterium]